MTTPLTDAELARYDELMTETKTHFNTYERAIRERLRLAEAVCETVHRFFEADFEGPAEEILDLIREASKPIAKKIQVWRKSRESEER
jgi:hypothetical protein